MISHTYADIAGAIALISALISLSGRNILKEKLRLFSALLIIFGILLASFQTYDDVSRQSMIDRQGKNAETTMPSIGRHRIEIINPTISNNGGGGIVADPSVDLGIQGYI